MAPLVRRCGGLPTLALAAAAVAAAGEGGQALAGASPAANAPQLRATAGRQLLDANETALALEQGLFFPDAPDGLCQLGYNCSSGNIPNSRGVCVMTSTGNQCWDVCNPEHMPKEYETGDDAAENAAFAGLVAQVRAGLNSYVQCPGQLGMGDPCSPGSLCKGHMLFKFKVKEGRGMCVVDESEPNGRACWDMCSGGHDPEDFVVGTAQGTQQKVWEMRSNGGCPSTSWWPWIFVALVSVCLLACCAWVFVVLFRMGRKRTRGLNLERPTARQELVEQEQEYKEPAPPPVMEDQRLDSSDYDARGYSGREDYRIPEPPPMEMNQDRMPPEPPREVQMNELPAPPGDPKMHLFDQIDANHDGQITREEYERFFPGAAQARIPGLDEPNLLFSNIQPLVVPQTTAQVAPPDLLSQAVPRNMFLSPDPLGGSQPQVITPFLMSTTGSQPAFQTQLPPAFSTQPPLAGSTPNSLQMRPGALSPALSARVNYSEPQASQPFFTQLARR